MTATLDTCIETVDCPLCERQEAYDVVIPAQYAPDVGASKLREIFSSSSDQPLLDQLVRCRRCQLVYTNPRVKEEIITASYSEAVDPTFLAQNEFRVQTFRRNFDRVLKHLSHRPDRSQKVLDVGCAGGAFPKAAHDLGFTVTGVEPSAWLCEQGRKLYGLDLRPGTLSDHPFSPESFHFVSYWDVLEHLPHPAAEIRLASGLLRKDGYLLANVPDYGSWACRLLGKRWPFYLSVHLIYFTRATMTALLRKNGFEVIRMQPYFQTLSLPYVLKRAGQIIKPFGWLEALANAAHLQKLPCQYNVGQTLFVARKK
jgi:SAM-dependent methyltransferase